MANEDSANLRQVDRSARERLAATLEKYLAEEITAFPFDDAIREIQDASNDPTVDWVANSLWFHYDDCKDHRVVLSKDEWDYFQRLILLLRSDAHVIVDFQRQWSFAQVVAGLALLLFAASVAMFGVGSHLLAVVLPLGCVSIAIARWRRSSRAPEADMRTYPFASMREIFAVRRAVPGFSKRRYPPVLRTRTIRSPILNGALALPTYALWLCLAPVVLLWQSLPASIATTRVTTP